MLRVAGSARGGGRAESGQGHMQKMLSLPGLPESFIRNRSCLLPCRYVFEPNAAKKEEVKAAVREMRGR